MALHVAEYCGAKGEAFESAAQLKTQLVLEQE